MVFQNDLKETGQATATPNNFPGNNLKTRSIMQTNSATRV